MIYLKLFFTFFKIGLFSFGGGYAMIPMIQKELQVNHWLDAAEFADIVAISQMTPGPLAVNAATYIGVKVAGVLGSTFATLGVSLPSFILVVAIANFFAKFKENYTLNSVLRGIRPVTIGLISSAVIFFAGMSIFTFDLSFSKLGSILSGNLPLLRESIQIHIGPLLIFVIILISVKKYKMHPILAVLVSALLGILVA